MTFSLPFVFMKCSTAIHIHAGYQVGTGQVSKLDTNSRTVLKLGCLSPQIGTVLISKLITKYQTVIWLKKSPCAYLLAQTSQ